MVQFVVNSYIWRLKQIATYLIIEKYFKRAKQEEASKVTGMQSVETICSAGCIATAIKLILLKL